MAVEITWLQTERVVLSRFGETVTTEDIRNTSLAVDALINQGVGVHGITDLSNVKSFPANLTKIQNALSVPPSQRGWMVMVIPEGNPLLQFVGSYAGHLRAIDGRFRTFRTFAAAVEFLHHTR
jgi:hypothetical protein